MEPDSRRGEWAIATPIPIVIQNERDVIVDRVLAEVGAPPEGSELLT